MSSEALAMDTILSWLTDGIYTSATQLRGYRKPDTMAPDELPFVQVFSPVSETSGEDYRQRFGTLTFQLQIIDKRERTEVVRDAMEVLGKELANQPGGSITNVGYGQMDLRGLDERAPSELVVAGATISVAFFDSLRETGETDVSEIAGNADNALSFVALLRNSELGFPVPIMTGGIEVQKTAVGTTEIGVIMPPPEGQSFPIDLSVTNVLRVLIFLPEADIPEIVKLYLILDTDPIQITYESPTVQRGWNEIVADLTNVSPVLRSVTNGVWVYARYNDGDYLPGGYTFLIKRIYYTARDMGSVPNLETY